MRRFLTIAVPTVLGVLAGLALAQQPVAQSNPLKPTAYAEAIVSVGEVADGVAGVWVLSNDGRLSLCTARMSVQPETPRCAQGVAP